MSSWQPGFNSPVAVGLILVILAGAALAVLLLQLVHLALVIAWGDQKTAGLGYYGLPQQQRRRFRRVLRWHRALLAPTVWLLSRTSGYDFRRSSFTFKGVPAPRGLCSIESFRRAVNYQPRDEDLFVATQMKCGTTLTQHLVFQLLTRGTRDLPAEGKALYSLSPWLESHKTVPVEQAPRIGHQQSMRIVKTHLPAKLCPFSATARYIYVVRHPVSCFGSCVDFLSDNLGPFAPPLKEFEAWYTSDALMWWTGWPDHVAGWWERAQECSNVLLVRFEDLVQDLPAVAIRIAEFLGLASLSEDELAQITHKCSFAYMQQHAECFEMNPPHVLQGRGKFFFSGRADRHRGIPPEVRERIAAWCRARMPLEMRRDLAYAELAEEV